MAEPTKEMQGMREIKFRAYRESTKSWVYGVFASRDSVLPPNIIKVIKENKAK